MIRSIKKFLPIGLVFFLCFFTSHLFAQINRDNENLGQDLESLGLDNIESKPELVKNNAKKKSVNKKENDLSEIANKDNDAK